MLWSMEVSHGALEYGRSTGVSLGVLEYHLEYRIITWSTGVSFGVPDYHLEYWSIIWSTGVLRSRSVDTFLTVAI
jgi:hypothetical protein